MATALRIGPYRFFFYAGDGGERMHTHVRRDRSEFKFWLDPVRLGRNREFDDYELNHIERLVVEHAPALRYAWYEYFRT